MADKNEDIVELNLVDLFHYLRKRWLILLLALSIFAAGSYTGTKLLVTPTYTATSTAFMLSDLSGNGNSVVYQDIQISTYLLMDYEILITSRTVTTQVIEELGLNMSHSQIVNMVTVTVPENTRTVQISVVDTNPQRAADIANSIMKHSAEMIKNTMRLEAVNIIDEAVVPSAPTSPNVSRNTLLGGAIGLILAIVVLTIIHVVDDSIRTEEDAERYLGLPTFGVIPLSDEIAVAPTHNQRKLVKSETLRK